MKTLHIQPNYAVDNPLSMIQAVRKVNGEKQTIFYIVPGSRENEFIRNPNLFDTSVDAKSIYAINSIDFKSDEDRHLEIVNNMFDQLVKTMGGDINTD